MAAKAQAYGSKELAAEAGWAFRKKEDYEQVPPFNLQIVEKFSVWLLNSDYHKNELTPVIYAINDYFERQGWGRPWKHGKQDGSRLFKIEAVAYKDLRRQYDLMDGRTIQEGGAARVMECGWETMLEEAYQELDNMAIGLIPKRGTKASTAQRKAMTPFLRKMRSLTMFVFVLRASSSRIDQKEMIFLDSGHLKLNITFWKRTGEKVMTAESISKVLPTAPEGARADHPRTRYLELMRTVVDAGGFVDLEKDVDQQHKVISDVLPQCFGGKQKVKQLLPKGRSLTSHTCRKSGASAAYACGLRSLTALQKWGEWDQGAAGAAIEYWGALKNYVDKTYEVTTFSRQLFDFLM